MLTYWETAPSAILQAFVDCFWAFLVDADEPSVIHHVVPPDGTVSLVYIRGQSPPRERVALVGPRVEALHRSTAPGDVYLGARLRPGAAEPFLGIAPSHLRDRVEDAMERLPDLAVRLLRDLAEATTPAAAGRAFECALAPFADRGSSVDPVVREAADRLRQSHGTARVAAIAAAVGLGSRQLRRRFQAATGLAPKEFARAQRVRQVCIAAVEPGATPWIDVAADSGFADQAHLAREMRRLMGMPPSAVAKRLRRIRHLALR